MKPAISPVQLWGSLGLFTGGLIVGLLGGLLQKLAYGGDPLVPDWLLWASYGCFALACAGPIFIENGKFLGKVMVIYFIALIVVSLSIFSNADTFANNKMQWALEQAPNWILAIVSLFNIYFAATPPWVSTPSDEKPVDE